MEGAMRQHTHRWVTVAAIVLILAAAIPASLAAQPSSQVAPAAIPPIYLPLVQAPPSLAGIFDCVETEFGLGWLTEVVTLNPDGSSLYQYGSPINDTISGTWIYTPTTQIVELRNFRWPTAIVRDPDHFSNSQYLPEQGFEISIGCTRRTAALAEVHG
jgi:hypothetical protein